MLFVYRVPAGLVDWHCTLKDSFLFVLSTVNIFCPTSVTYGGLSEIEVHYKQSIITVEKTMLVNFLFIVLYKDRMHAIILNHVSVHARLMIRDTLLLEETLLVIGRTWTQVLEDRMAVALSTLNHCVT